MDALTPFKVPSAQRCVVVALGTLLFAFSSHNLPAQVGNQNPAGPSGAFNGQINTGCSYDPYTGNATRSITDIVVAGAVGEYPLALVRTANSRTPSTTEVFGMAGGWNHNYNWILEDSPTSNTANFQPKRYTVDFPDGRVETFRAVTWDSVYRVRPGADTPAQSTSSGVRERFLQLNLNNMYAYLILPDGGAVEFKASQHVTNGGRYYYKYHATGIYDPHGLKTQLVSSMTPSGAWRHLDWVIEPAGRSLHFLYTGANNPKIASVTASDGRTVNYYYAYCNGCRLNRVRYYNNPAWDAQYQYCNSNVGQGLPPLLWTADDPMYAGPMKRIAYDYKPLTPNNPDGTTPVYGQILRERYWDGVSGHETNGAAVSSLAVGTDGVHTGSGYRKETRADGAIRGFVYTGAGFVAWASDFMGHQSTMGYDDKKYLNSFIDFNRNETNYTNDPLTGNVTQIQFPFTHGDTPNQTQRPTINYTYTNSYYLHTIQDEGNHTTTFTRNGNNRVTRIDYPDDGYETFGYDASHFYQISSHRMTTGGTETFAYDGSDRLQYYSDPYHSNPDNPSIHYFYEGHGWVNGIYDALSHPTNWTYNDRGQPLLTTLPTDPSDGNRHTITNVYYPDGTLHSKTDELGHLTSYTYDDYRRLKTVTLPARGDGSGTHTTNFYYGANAWDAVNDYRLTDSNVTWIVLPSTKKVHNVYDDNRRKQSVTVAPNTNDEVTSSYTYDATGNVTSVTDPMGHWTNTIYDERNRPSSTNHMAQTSTFTYDTAGHKKTIQRPNGQTITYDTFDVMNRVTQQTATQNPSLDAVTKFTYYTTGDGQNAPVGLLKTMKDPHLVQLNNGQTYTYEYDLMGRKKKITYPKDSANINRTEEWNYDEMGRLDTSKNRKGNTQTFSYDALNRMTGFTWDDTPRTPGVSFTYDAASRLVEIDNANAHVSRSYFNDDLLHTETQDATLAGGVTRTITYGYDDDANRGTLQIPGYAFDYQYTNRNQLKNITDHAGGNTIAHYEYDLDAKPTLRNVYTTPLTHTDYTYDGHDRVTWVTHTLNGTTRSFNYGYYDDSNDLKFVKRLGTGAGNVGDAFRYDDADQAISFQLDMLNPDQASLPQRVFYDPNGNRTTFTAAEQYDPANNLNQYTSRNNANAAYDSKGNMTTGLDGSTYTYDAQNRLLTANNDGASMSFKYDGLNRQVSRTVSGTTTYSTWDGWNLVEDYHMSGNSAIPDATYLHGPTGLVKELRNTRYYYEDGTGSTSHISDDTGHLLEWYRYDLQGKPFIYDANNNQLSTSTVRHLFTGQQWYGEIGLYDLRNRFYSPDIGRFLQPDPIGFNGDATNLYRYCGNNPVFSSDPNGEYAVLNPGGWYTYVVNPGWGRYVWASGYVPGSNGWCAAGAQILSGGYSGGSYHDMPNARDYWYQGASLTSATRFGTVIATGWQDGGYPSLSPADYQAAYGTNAMNHTAIFLYFDKYGNAVVLDQYVGKPLGKTIIPPDQQWEWNEVYVDKGDGPYNNGTSTDPNGRGGIIVSAAPLSKNEQAKLKGLARLGRMYNPYWGYLPTTNTMNWAGGRAGLPNGSFSWTSNDSFQNSVLNWGDVGRDMYTNFLGAGEPGIGPGCFVAGTPVLMADGGEKPIESIQIGEIVLGWNEETKATFSTKVVSVVHHDEKMQTLFDIELEDGRSFTVNNDHPMYVVEDSDFKFTDELAVRFAKGEAITFQDSDNQPVKVVSLQMRKQRCKVYNLHVEGQGKNGHTYYANGILVHNSMAANRFK